jgi:hypothetical protein
LYGLTGIVIREKIISWWAIYKTLVLKENIASRTSRTLSFISESSSTGRASKRSFLYNKV